MSRIARVVLEGVPYHVTQRGNGKQQVFFDSADYHLYLSLLRHHAQACGLQVWAYCLMPNHVHLVAVPRQPLALSKTLGRTHAGYAQHFNLRRQSCGHVWQSRFFSCPLDTAHLWHAMAYVERNPVRAGLVEEAGSYRWSSATSHAGGRDPEKILTLDIWQQEYTAIRWQETVRASGGDEILAERLREATIRGRPLGTEAFVQQLERKAGRRLRPLPAGRPRKETGRSADGPPQLAFEIGV